MGCRTQEATQYTIAIAMIDRYIHNLEDYIDKIEELRSLLDQEFKIGKSDILINTADSYEQESVYLTVSGTSAESGDDGQVGRGNRINGLITPYHPMSLEAAAGKNPVSHVGKIYNHFAYDLCKDLVKQRFADHAEVFMVSQIGKPITEPAAMHIRLAKQAVEHQKIQDYVHTRLPELANYWTKILARKPGEFDFEDN
jgi:S-adenosylmethionine synthetase